MLHLLHVGFPFITHDIFIAISIILVITTFKYAVLANWNSFLFIVE